MKPSKAWPSAEPPSAARRAHFSAAAKSGGMAALAANKPVAAPGATGCIVGQSVHEQRREQNLGFDVALVGGALQPTSALAAAGRTPTASR